jgi:hypothetical protein
LGTFTWKSPTDGLWDTAANWDQGAVPGDLDTAIIARLGTFAVTNTGDRTVKLVAQRQASAALSIADGTFATERLTNRGNVVVAGGSDDATLTIGYSTINSGTITLSGVGTGAATLLVGDDHIVRLTGGGAVVLDGTLSAANIVGDATASSLINENNTIEGAGAIRDGVGTLALDNQAAGVIDANVDDETLLIDLATAGTNAGIMRASNGGLLTLRGDWRFNHGVLDANNGTVRLDQTSINGRISLQSEAAGVISLNFGVTGLSGTIATSGNILVDGDANGANTQLIVEHRVANSGTITVRGGVGVGQLQVGDGTVRLDGAGTVVLDGTVFDTQIVGATPGSKLENVDNLIHGAGSLGNDTLAIVNDAAGTISADVAGETLLIDSASFPFTNYGELNATDGGILLIRNAIKSIGPDAEICADGSSSTVVLENAFLTGTYHLHAEAGSQVTVAAGLSTLAGKATLDGAINVDAVANGGVTQLDLLANTVTNHGTITLTGGPDVGDPDPSFAYLTIDDKGVLLNGGGSIVINGASNSFNGISGMVPESFLINVDNTIAGSGGIFVDLYNDTAGVIDANIAGETLEVNDSRMTNAGTMQSSSGGTLLVEGNMLFKTGGVLQSTGSGSQTVLEDLYMFGPAKLESVIGGSVAVTDFNAVLTSLTVEGTLSMDANLFNTTPAFDPDSVLLIDGTLVNHGVINIAGYIDTCGCPVYGALLVGDVGASLTGGGTIVLGGDPGTALIEEQSLDFSPLVNLDNHIEGTGSIGHGNLFLRNQDAGVIEANVDGEQLLVDTGDNAISNKGTLKASDGGILTVASDLRGGTGLIDDATMAFEGAASSAVSFVAGEAVLELDKSGSFTGTVAGLNQSSDYEIDLTDIDFATVTASFKQYDGKGALSVTDGTDSARLKLIGDFAASVFTGPAPAGAVGFLLSNDGSGGTTVSYLTPSG